MTLLEWAFRVCWRLQAAAGNCDELDGKEYRRVLHAFSAFPAAERCAWSPQRLLSFIRHTANVSPAKEAAAELGLELDDDGEPKVIDKPPSRS